MSAHWGSPEQEEAMQWMVSLLATARSAGVGIATTPEEDGGWSVDCVSQSLSQTAYHDFDLAATSLGEADDLHHALAAAKRKLERIADELRTRPS